MFDLNIIENDWLSCSHELTEDDILKLFIEDDATILQYNKKMDEWFRKTKVNIPQISAEERLLRNIFSENYEKDNEQNKQIKRMERLKEIKLAKYPKPKKQHLSIENQKKVIEGSMHIVFKSVRYYYQLFEEKIEEETLYYLFVESLIKITKYMVHCGKPVFYLYVKKSFYNRMVEYISNIKNISFEEAKSIIRYYEYKLIGEKSDNEFINHDLTPNIKEDLLSPNEINKIIEKEKIYEDPIKNINTENFFKDYRYILNELAEDERLVMQLSYTCDGYPGLTYKEISEYLGYPEDKVSQIKKRAIRHIRSNTLLNKYRNK